MSELRQRMIECLQLNTLPPSPSVVSDSSTTNAAKKLVHLRVVARAAREEAVPVILSKDEVRQILSRLPAHVTEFVSRPSTPEGYVFAGKN